MKFENISIKSFLVFVIACYINCRQIGKKNTRDTNSILALSDDNSDISGLLDDFDDEFDDNRTKRTYSKKSYDSSNIRNISNNSDIKFQNKQKNSKKNDNNKRKTINNKMLSDINIPTSEEKPNPYLLPLRIDNDNLKTRLILKNQKTISDIIDIYFYKNELKDQEHNKNTVLKKINNNITNNSKIKSKH